MDITETTMGAGALWELDNRLTYHKATGRILEGLKVSEEAEMSSVDGVDDLPHLRFYQIISDGDLGVGAPSDQTKIKGRNNTPVTEQLTALFLLSTDRDNGFIKRESSGEPGLLDWVSRIKDAIETPAFPNRITASGATSSFAELCNGDYSFNPETRLWEHEANDGYVEDGGSIWNISSVGGEVDTQWFEDEDGSGLLGVYGMNGGSDELTVVEHATPLDQPDAMLSNMLQKPVNFRMRDWEHNQTALTIMLEVILPMRSTCRAQRAFTVDPRLALTYVEED